MSGIKLEVGDLIEIFRVGHQHWGIFVGDGYVIHLAPPCEVAHAGSSSMMVFGDRAVVKKEKLSDVVGNDEYIINNLLDDKYEPRKICLVVKKAHRRIGRTLPYCVFNNNCEHFVTDLRYGKPKLRQVRNAAFGAAVAYGRGGVLGVVASVVLSKKKKKNKY